MALGQCYQIFSFKVFINLTQKLWMKAKVLHGQNGVLMEKLI